MTGSSISAYDWSGLRNRRIMTFAGIALIMPGSCVAALGDRFGTTWLVGFAVLVGSLLLLRGWSCPRCGGAFARQRSFPYVRPFGAGCRQCGLPEYTVDEASAPPPIPLPEEPPPRRSILRDPRTRVALVLAIPLVWMSTCRLPDGNDIEVSPGRRVRVLGLATNTQWTSGKGTTRSLVLSFYAPSKAGAVEDILNLALPGVKQTGDSVVVLQALRDDWWARAFGIRISGSSTYALQSDGTWQAR